MSRRRRTVTLPAVAAVALAEHLAEFAETGPEGGYLRHSVVTLALAAGANTRELMERMGHTSPQVALRCQHVMAGRDQAIAAALDELVQATAMLPAERPASSRVAR
jgi:integrase